MAKPESPCRDCKKRSVNCHSECALYIEYRATLDEFNNKLRQQKADYRERNNSARRFHI